MMDVERSNNNQAEVIPQENLTPMVKQYKEIKSRHLDKILLFRVGDFYEMFYEDAKIASDILKIALTSRNDMPMAGVPFHAADYYIQKLLQAGKKVAICEQVEDPSKSKGLVRREIVNIITPGTVIDSTFIPSAQNNFFCSIFSSTDKLGVVFSDVSTGEIFLSIYTRKLKEYVRNVLKDLNRFFPSEIIASENIKEEKLLLKEMERSGFFVEFYPEWYFSNPVFSDFDFTLLNGYDSVLSSALTGFLNYLFETQGLSDREFGEKLKRLFYKVEIVEKEKYLEMDDFTIRNLELVRNMQDGSKKYTLLEVLDDTITPMGSRLLRNWILMPLLDICEINKRLNYVEAFYDAPIILSDVRKVLKGISDIERIVSRVVLKKVIPKDIKSLSQSLKAFSTIKAYLLKNDELKEIVENLPTLDDLSELIDKAIVDDPPSTFNGEVIKEGYSEELDEIRRSLRESKDYLINLQEKERNVTGIPSLKVKYNQILGYFLEIPKTHLSKVPSHYIRKQSLVSAERYTIPELTEYEMKISNASLKLSQLEEEIFSEIVDKCVSFSGDLQKISHTLAMIDVLSSLAKVASENRYVKPKVEESLTFYVTEGRHPVVEKYIGKGTFVPNDIHLGDEDSRIIILTGPNMAGKSTYLRQTALIAIMAQMGSFVPATEARIGLVDRIFTRIGASDNLSGGESTFLIEMKEAARILKNSTSRSLIIMDELGRGTSTYDGLSIAWAVIEYIHEHPERCGKTLFATHYHELTALSDRKGIKNLSMAVREYNDELVFLRKVVDGPSDKSYGIFVAKLAGIPEEVIERAKVVLSTLEKEGSVAQKIIENIFDNRFRKNRGSVVKKDTSLELFPDFPYQAVIDRIKNIDINRMTPLEALNFLEEIKKQIES